jgi:D-3-phosphoglycerate dehydrogenase
MKKLLYYKMLNFQPANLKLLEDNFEILTLENPTQDKDEILEKVEVAFAPLGFQFNQEKIDKMPNLKVIASNTTGESHIDRAYAESKGIKVFSLKYEQEFLGTITPTAEHTWGLILALIRHTPWAYQSVLAGYWNRRLFGGKAMLSKMTLGIVGLGRLGRLVADYAKSFKMPQVMFFDPNVPADVAPDIKKMPDLETLVAASDIVSVHIPAEKETHKIFNRELFQKFKPGSFFINTSRGELVDEEALVESLASGHLAGAALDVFDGEYQLDCEKIWQEHPLLKYAKEHDNLLITPHIGGSTLDAWLLTEERVIIQTIDYLKK